MLRPRQKVQQVLQTRLFSEVLPIPKKPRNHKSFISQLHQSLGQLLSLAELASNRKDLAQVLKKRSIAKEEEPHAQESPREGTLKSKPIF